MRIYTFGHGTAGEVDLASLIRGAGIRRVVDVRSIPKSRAHPHVWRERMEEWVPELAAAAYVWSPQLGGFRRARADSENVGLRNPAFRGYADYMQTEPFEAALHALLEEGAEDPTAVMCSETLWWRCHRRLIADALVLLHGVDVQHVTLRQGQGALQPHRPTPGARVLPNGTLRYDALEE